MIYGEVKHFHEDGSIASSGKQYQEKKIGKWQYFDQSGNLLKEEIWERGELKETIQKE